MEDIDDNDAVGESDGNDNGNAAGGEDPSSSKSSWVKVRMQAISVKSVHSALKAAMDDGKSPHMESVRIFMNGSQVFSHMFGTLAYCVKFPAAMEALMGITMRSVCSEGLVQGWG